MNASSASATSAAARMDIEKAAQDARTMFFITCAPLTGKTGGDFAGAPQQALRKIMRAPDERRQAPARLSRSRRRQETASFPGAPVTTSLFSAPAAADPRGAPSTAPRWPWCRGRACRRSRESGRSRSEEHTSELQSHVNLVCRLLLEKKKKKKIKSISFRETKKRKY